MGKTVEETTATKIWRLEPNSQAGSKGKFKLNIICTTASKGSEIATSEKSETGCEKEFPNKEVNVV